VRAQEAHTMSNDSVLADVRRQLGLVRGSRGQRVYSPQAKRAAAALARDRQRQGHSIASTARSLGVHPVVLGAWTRALDASASGAFVPVAVRDVATVVAAQPVVVHAPSGLRVEGLSLDQITTLLRGLR
jgi:transposase-like protein